MDGRQFEHYLGHLFKSHGYDVKVTQAAGDFGADLISRDELVEMILKLNPTKATPTPKQVIEQIPQDNKVCSRCGNQMVLCISTNLHYPPIHYRWYYKLGDEICLLLQCYLKQQIILSLILTSFMSRR
jgi:hypothetical protein